MGMLMNQPFQAVVSSAWVAGVSPRYEGANSIAIEHGAKVNADWASAAAACRGTPTGRIPITCN
jgi:hypothetical protein